MIYSLRLKPWDSWVRMLLSRREYVKLSGLSFGNGIFIVSTEEIFFVDLLLPFIPFLRGRLEGFTYFVDHIELLLAALVEEMMTGRQVTCGILDEFDFFW